MFPTKVSESRERGEGDYHEVRSGRTKVEAQKHRKVTTTKGHKSDAMLARRPNENFKENSKDVRSEIRDAVTKGLNNNYL